MTVLLVDALLTLFFTLIIPPFMGLVIVVVCLASLGKSLGIRRRYVQILLKVFEFGKQRTAEKRNQYIISGKKDDEEDKRSGSISTSIQDIIFNGGSKLVKPNPTHDFALSDCFDYLVIGMKAIVDDEVTKRFYAEELKSWNFLTRTNRSYEFISIRLTILWALGFIIRYFFLLPLRISILSIGVGFLIVSTSFLSLLPDGKVKQALGHGAYLTTFRIVTRSISAVITFHNTQHRPRTDGFCVANHTTPFDAALLASDNIFSFVGQRHGGFLSIFQRALSRASDHIWFERGEVKDRFAVAKRLREHVEDPNKMPILIFPEGTCINNTSVMQFKKGTFEVGGIIYPVAIKYDPRFADAFWNSSQYSMVQYIYMLMTSWAIVCDVWYLPPMVRKESESSIDFANRVKAEIAAQGGLVDLVWDGALKRSAPKKEWREQFQQIFSRTLKLDQSSAIQRKCNDDSKIENSDIQRESSDSKRKSSDPKRKSSDPQIEIRNMKGENNDIQMESKEERLVNSQREKEE